ncbi:MAG: ATP synthase F1 subunit gamma [Endomicrobiales bacterium]|nr:ATP synthase F1 subunit gamma [Endomicrobiales bacterium]
MAENLNTLKRRIKTSQNISQIAKAMAMISASKIRKAKEAVVRNRPYALGITSMLERILRHIELNEVDSPYVTPVSKTAKRLVLAISPDKGLCGALSDNIARGLLKFDVSKISLITVGKKIEKTAAGGDFDIIASFPSGTRFPKYESVFSLIDVVENEYLSGKVSGVDVLYARFQSVYQQVPTVETLLPFEFGAEKSGVHELVYKFEPDIQTVFTELLPYYVETKIYEVLINAFTSEQAARMVAMQNAKDNASDITNFFTLVYNKLRQEKITKEILDISNTLVA